MSNELKITHGVVYANGALQERTAALKELSVLLDRAPSGARVDGPKRTIARSPDLPVQQP